MIDFPDQIRLSLSEKFSRLEALWEEIETQPPSITSKQAAELDRRMTT